MRTIPLTRGKVTLVDNKDYKVLAKYNNWCALHVGRTWYAIRWLKDKQGKRKRLVLMHRQILGVKSRAKVDHQDGNGLNNRRKNLRLATGRENSRNQVHRRKGCSSRFKGVRWHKLAKKWVAEIRDGEQQENGNSRSRHLGCFGSEIAAAKAYNSAARESFGDFAALNFPIAGSVKIRG